jgi:hypothetical protein
MTVTSVPGRFFFICTGAVKHVERAGFSEPIHQRPEQLRIHVVDLALDLNDALVGWLLDALAMHDP